MARVRIRLTRSGPRKLRNEPGVVADLAARARRIAAVAGPGMQHGASPGRNRARGFVVTATPEARRAEAEHRALTRAIDAGRR